MKLPLHILIFLFITIGVYAQEQQTAINVDSVEKSFKFQKGVIHLRNGLGTLTVPAGYKYLDPEQSERVLTELWGNPKEENLSLGMLLREEQRIMAEKGYVFNIGYDEIGYVKDDDAEEINYGELLTEMQKEVDEGNTERVKAGYTQVKLVRWASAPFYDGDRKILHWAKELKFGESPVNTLNYNVRILGRKGVLVMNAIAGISDLPEVKKDLPRVLNIFEFSEDYKYKSFNPDVDEVAAWTIGGLVAGKVLAKVGMFALLLKFWKVIAMGAIAAFAFIKRLITGRKKDEEINEVEEVVPVTEKSDD